MFATEPCESLAWDSAFFGIRIARVLGDQLNPGRVEQIDRWCAEHHIELLYFAGHSADAQTVICAETAGFHLVDLRSTFGRRIRSDTSRNIASVLVASGASQVRLVHSGDVPGLEVIARQSHRDSRFYYDGRLPRDRCDELFASWIRNSVQGYSAAVLVCGAVGSPTGYVTCHLDQDGRGGSIGLIAVEPAQQGKGLGRMLVHEAVGWIGQRGAKEVSVVTQGRNLTAQRLYERCGFVARGLQLYYHKWYLPTGQSKVSQ